MPASLDCLAVTPPGLAGLASRELRGLGIASGAITDAGVAFTGGPSELARANLGLRIASRVLVRLASFPARAFYELERKAKRVPWQAVLSPGTPVRFRVTSRKSRLYHLDGIAERLLAGSQGAGEPGSQAADGEEPDEAGDVQLFVVRVYRDEVTISADSSGALLHRRGYRLATAKAPLRETLAAAMLLGAGYREGVPLVDPFCGSGTLPIEAALISRRIAPGLGRSFACERWPSLDPATFAQERAESRARILPAAAAPIMGSDRDAGAIRAAAENAGRAGVASDIRFEALPFSEARPGATPGLLAANPPYGVRVGSDRDLRDLYAALGRKVREQWEGWRVALLVSGEMPEREMRLPLETRWESRNGGLPVKLLVREPGSQGVTEPAHQEIET